MVDKLNMESKNILSENIENIASLFPNALVESENGKKIDFDILKQELSADIVDGPRERYHLDFPGKREAIVEANRKTTKTLRPIKEKSVDFENTKNIYIEGDNLEALKILQESYLGKIKCIYIDPPYNTGNDFVYNDKFSHSTEEELKASGRIDDDGNVLISKDINNDSNGRYHSDWLKMMYPRLKLARNLLSDDGVIFISIDDNEVDNLRKICDEVLGEKNFVATIKWKKTNKPSGNTSVKNYLIDIKHEYILVYKRDITEGGFLPYFSTDYELDSKGYTLKDNYFAERGYYKLTPLWHSNSGSSFKYNKSCDYEIVAPDGTKFGIYQNENKPKERWMCYTWGKETFDIGNKLGFIEIKQDQTGHWCAYRKMYTKVKFNPKDKIIENIASCNAYDDYYLEKTTDDAAREINNLNLTFSYSKPKELLMRLLTISNLKEGDIILDFFSGSATTAHAVMKLNAEDGGSRQYIMVQLPEATAEGSEAHKAGFNTICDIGEERIRRAGKKIKEENEMLTKDLDVGFRVYKVDSTNMKDIYYTPDKIDQNNLLDMVSNVKEDRNEEDLLTQVILNLGLPLDMHIEEKTIGKNKVFFVEQNALVACFDDTIDLKILEEIAKVNPLKICLRESSFEKDQDKINFFERLKKLSPDTETYII